MSIVIPAADTKSHCRWMLDDLLTSIERGNYNEPTIVCFDQCGRHFVNFFTKKYPWMIPIVNNGNRHGFAKNSNKGLAMSYRHYKQGAFVLNMDTVLPDSKWMEQVKNEGLASPAQVDLNPDQDPYAIDDTITKLHHQPETIVYKNSIKFGGFCMWFSLPLLDRAGFLDEVFYATFEDDDICVRANLAGLPCQEVGVNVHHYISKRETEVTTTGAYTLQSMQRSLLQFAMKWNIPDDMKHEEFNTWILNNHKWKDEMRCRMSDDGCIKELENPLVSRMYDVADSVYAMLPENYQKEWRRLEQEHKISIRKAENATSNL